MMIITLLMVMMMMVIMIACEKRIYEFTIAFVRLFFPHLIFLLTSFRFFPFFSLWTPSTLSLLSVFLSLCLSVFLSLSPSVCLSVCLSVSVFLSVSACLHLSLIFFPPYGYSTIYYTFTRTCTFTTTSHDIFTPVLTQSLQRP